MDGDQTIEFNGWLLTADFGGSEEAEEAPGNDSIFKGHFVEKEIARGGEVRLVCHGTVQLSAYVEIIEETLCYFIVFCDAYW